MNTYLLDFLNTSQDPHVVQLKNKIEKSLDNLIPNDFQSYWNELRKYFYKQVNSSDGKITL